MIVGEKMAITEKENEGIISNYASEGYRTIHKNEHIKECRHNKSWSESKGRRKVISQTDKSYEGEFTVKSGKETITRQYMQRGRIYA